MEEITMFDILYPRYRITKPIRLIELFGGVGSQAMALRNIGASFEHYKLVEFDKFAIQSYNAIHETDFPTTDITEVNGKDLGITDTDKYEYMMTYSFPCQDLSVAGKGKGMSRDSGTRSGLLWEVERLLDETEHLPQVLLMENVPQVISNKNRPDFEEWCHFLERKGYYNYYSKLNAKDYGVAQNRNRVFMVSVLGEYSYEFPESVELTKTVKDYLEDEVDEKFYINTEKAKQLISKIDDKYKIGANQVPVDGTIKNPKPKDVSNCIKARYDAGIQNQQSVGTMVIEPIVIGGMQKNQSVKTDGVSTTLTSSMGTGGGHVPMIVDDLYLSRPPREYVESSPSLRTNAGGLKVIEPTIVAQRGRNPDNPSDRTAGSPTEQRLEPNQKGLCNTLTSVQKDNLVLEPAILTPKRTEYGKSIRKDYESGKIQESRHNMTELQPREDGISNTLTTVQKDNLMLEPKRLGGIVAEPRLEIHSILKGGKWDKIYESARRVYSQDGICPTIPTCQGGNTEPKVAVKQPTIDTMQGGNRQPMIIDDTYKNRDVRKYEKCSPTLRSERSGFKVAEPKVAVKQATKKGYIECKIGGVADLSYPDSKTRRGRVQENGDVSPTLTASETGISVIENMEYRIRKLTPKECWRLMGFTDEDFHKAESVCSNSQLYKQAGNSIVVPVLEGIFKQLLGD